MKPVMYVFSLACSILQGGCCRSTHTEAPLSLEKEAPPMTPKIQILNLSLTEKTLALDFRVSNSLEDDIQICYDTAVYGKQNVQHAVTRIDGDMVRVILRCSAARAPVFVNPPSVGKYVRLLPGESCSGRIVRDLPIKDGAREWRESHKEHKEIVLHRVAFEVGYFGPKWNSVLDSRFERFKEQSVKPKVDGPYYYLPDNPLIMEETLDGQLREVMYLNYDFTPWISNEEYAEVLIAEVNIPCSVVVENK